MAQLQQLCVLRCKEGNSDKVWGALAVQTVEGTWALITCWGKTGSDYESKCDTLTQSTAQKQLDKKVTEKIGKGYRDVLSTVTDPSTETLYVGLRISVPKKLAETYAEVHPDNPLELTGLLEASSACSLTSAGSDALAIKGPVPSHIQPLPPDDLQTILADSDLFGIQEKVNGTRCLIVSDGMRLQAFNRRGVAQNMIPVAAQRLETLLPASFIFDGERLEGEDAGKYLIFDMLAYDDQSLRERPYQDRITNLERVLVEAEIIESGGATAKRAYASSRAPGLGLLTVAESPLQKQLIFDEVMQNQGEGIIVRTLSGHSIPGDTRVEKKYKLLADLDVVAWRVSPGDTGSGSLCMALVRPADKALIDVGKVRSGLIDPDIDELKKLIDLGQFPVLQVRFLPIRTIGKQLVEPRVCRVRDDKQAGDCTTDQLVEVLGPARAQATTDLIKQAQPIPNVTLFPLEEKRSRPSVLTGAQHTRRKASSTGKASTPKKAELVQTLQTTLTAAFPGVTFAVHRRKQEVGECLQIAFTDGPTIAEATLVISQFAHCVEGKPNHFARPVTSDTSTSKPDETINSPSITAYIERELSIGFLQECAKVIGDRYGVRKLQIWTFQKGPHISGGEQRVEFGPNGATIADKVFALAKDTSRSQQPA